MSKFKRGETSKTVIDKKNAITKSILRKAELINKVMTYNDIPSSLEIKKGAISQTSVHKWSDDELKIISYSRNSAHAEHNTHAIITLIESINNANTRLTNAPESGQKNDGKSITRLSENEINKLQKENDELKIALAEVYRAYMQLVDSCREDKQIDNAYRKLLLSQARILGKNRLWGVE